MIEARVFEENGRVMMEKTCPQHGDFRDCVSSDARLYLKMEKWTFGDNQGVSNPADSERYALPGPVRPVLHAHQPHGAGQRGPDQPLQPDLPGLLRQRQRRRLPLRAEPGAGAAHARRRCAARSRWPTASCSFRAASRPSTRTSSKSCAWPRTWGSRICRRPPTGSCSPTSSSPCRRRRPACTRCTCSSTAFARTSTSACAASRCSKRRCRRSRTCARRG